MARKKKLATEKQINFFKLHFSVSLAFCPPGESSPSNTTIMIINDILMVEFWVFKTSNGLDTMIIVGSKPLGVISPARLVKTIISELIEQESFAVLVDICGYTDLFADACRAEYCPIIECEDKISINLSLYNRLKDYHGRKSDNYGMFLVAAPSETPETVIDAGEYDEKNDVVESQTPEEDLHITTVEDDDTDVDKINEEDREAGWMKYKVGVVLHILNSCFKDRIVVNRQRLKLFDTTAYRCTLHTRYNNETENTRENIGVEFNITDDHIDFYQDPLNNNTRVTLYLVKVYDPILMANAVEAFVANAEALADEKISIGIVLMKNTEHEYGDPSIVAPMLKYKCTKVPMIIPVSSIRYQLYEVNL